MNQNKSVSTMNYNQSHRNEISQCGLTKQDVDQIEFDVFTRRNKKKTNYGSRLAKFFSKER